MTTITYRYLDGSERTIATDEVTTVRDLALDENLPGIEGDCGGQLNCATCHVYVDPAWADRLGEQSDIEADIIEGAAAELRPTSRLSCQLVVTSDAHGLVVTVPETQY